MIADGVDVMFPLLNVINLPGYLEEMVTQGVKPGQIQFYQSGYNAQNGDLVSSKVVMFAGDEARASSTTAPKIIAAGPTGAFRCPDFTAERVRRDVQPRVPGRGRRRSTPRPIPQTNSRVRRDGRQLHLRPASIARAIETAGPNPTRKDLAAAVGEPRRDRHRRRVPRQLRQGKYTAPNALNKHDVALSVRGRHAPVRRHVHPPRRRRLPDPRPDGTVMETDADAEGTAGPGRARGGGARPRKRAARRSRRRGPRSRSCPTTCCPASAKRRWACARRCARAARRW